MKNPNPVSSLYGRRTLFAFQAARPYSLNLTGPFRNPFEAELFFTLPGGDIKRTASGSALHYPCQSEEKIIILAPLKKYNYGIRL